MALRVSPEAQHIDIHLRDKAVQAVTRFGHLAKNAEKRKLEPEKKSKKATSGWAEKIETMRETYPNAYRPWLPGQDEELKQHFQQGESIKKLSKRLGRHEGSIKMRLQKHFGEDVVA